MEIVQSGSIEWELMWKRLSQESINEGDRTYEDFWTGECWQYMGTSREKSGRWIHHFRHRQHPKTKRRENIQIPASEDY